MLDSVQLNLIICIDPNTIQSFQGAFSEKKNFTNRRDSVKEKISVHRKNPSSSLRSRNFVQNQAQGWKLLLFRLRLGNRRREEDKTDRLLGGIETLARGGVRDSIQFSSDLHSYANAENIFFV